MKTCNHKGCSFKIFSNGFCTWHQADRTDERWIKRIEAIKKLPTYKGNNKPIAKHSLKTSVRMSNLHVLYESILSIRKNVSFVSGLKIEGNYSNCAHVLAKGVLVEWRKLYDKVTELKIKYKEQYG